MDQALVTVTELKTKRLELEGQLFHLIEKFENEHGVKVEKVELEHICRVWRQDCRLTRVNVEVVL